MIKKETIRKKWDKTKEDTKLLVGVGLFLIVSGGLVKFPAITLMMFSLALIGLNIFIVKSKWTKDKGTFRKIKGLVIFSVLYILFFFLAFLINPITFLILNFVNILILFVIRHRIDVGKMYMKDEKIEVIEYEIREINKNGAIANILGILFFLLGSVFSIVFSFEFFHSAYVEFSNPTWTFLYMTVVIFYALNTIYIFMQEMAKETKEGIENSERFKNETVEMKKRRKLQQILYTGKVSLGILTISSMLSLFVHIYLFEKGFFSVDIDKSSFLNFATVFSLSFMIYFATNKGEKQNRTINNEYFREKHQTDIQRATKVHNNFHPNNSTTIITKKK